MCARIVCDNREEGLSYGLLTEACVAIRGCILSIVSNSDASYKCILAQRPSSVYFHQN